MNKSESGKLGHLASKDKIDAYLLSLRDKYYENPNICKHCNSVIEYDKRSNVFCNSSCSQSFNNKKRKVVKLCLNCDNELTYGKKYCGSSCQRNFEYKERITKWMNGGTISSKVVKRFLIENFGYRCFCCGINDWNENKIILELEHIDGNSSNNDLNNLELLCPNCHSQTDTYKSKNNGRGRHSRRERYKEGKSY